jgi:two-component system sensor kinase FixL
MKHITLLVVIMTVVTLSVGVAALVVLYETAFEQQRQRLVETAKSRARLMEAVARFDQTYNRNYPRGARAATITQIRDAHENFVGFGNTGEFTLAKRNGDDIVFLLRHRHSKLDTPAPVPFRSNLAEPMRRALSGRSGTVVGLDYRGVTVLAAYEPVAVMDLGIVAKIDLAELRAPFLRAFGIVLTLAIALIAGGTILFYRVSNRTEKALDAWARQQAAVADLGRQALAGADLDRLFREAVAYVGDGLGVEYSGVLELLPDGKRLVLRAGRGWKDRYVGEATCSATNDLQAGFVLSSKEPVIVQDTRKETRFSSSPLLQDHEVSSGISVVIQGRDQPLGVLEADTSEKRAFSLDDVNFLNTLANILSEAVKHHQAEVALYAAQAQLERRVEERTTQLRQSLQHQHIIADILRSSLRAISLEEMLKEVLSLVLTSHELGLENKGCIFLVDDNTRKLVMVAYHGLPDSIADSCGRVPFGTCVCGRVAESGKFVHVSGVDARHEILYVGMTPHGHYCSPICSDSSVFGVLNLYVPAGQGKNEAEENFVKAVADTLAGIIRRKRAEEALAEAQARYRGLYNNAPDMFASVDAGSAKIIQCNRTLTEALGYAKEGLVSRDFFEIFQPNCLPQIREYFHTFVETGEVRNAELQLRHKDGERIDVSMNATAVRDETGKVVHGQLIFRDITERKLAEAQAREHQAQLAHVTRLGTAGEMATGIAHEVNQPLTAMVTEAQACLRLIDSGKAELAELREAMQAIAAQGLRAGEIIRRLKAFTRLRKTKRTIVGINELVKETVRFVEAEIREKDIGLTLGLADQLPPIEVDTIQLEQVILNLLRNAMDALEAVEVSQRELDIQTAVGESSMVELLVTDSGTGLSPEIAATIFDPFVSTKPQGMGMGLTISRSIVRTHGGRLWVDPSNGTNGKGTVFHLALPSRNPEARNEPGSNRFRGR